jgi:hypothetical protein
MVFNRVCNTVFVAVLVDVALLLAGWLPAEPIDVVSADQAARSALTILLGNEAKESVTLETSILSADGDTLAWVFCVDPKGFLVLSGNTDLPPIIAYSFLDELPSSGRLMHEFLGFLHADLGFRRRKVGDLALSALQARRRQWSELLSLESIDAPLRAMTRWPAAGTTSTGGWLETNWHQNAPYNDDCPMDLINAARSVAGCPAVAMAMIMNYHRTTNHTVFDDGDDYHHNCAGRNYWIDDDFATVGFPSFAELSSSLDALEMAYPLPGQPDDAGRAALVFGCGVAAHQVYTSTVSGTFGVAQAEQAYRKFAVDDAELLFDTNPDMYTRLSENMKHGLPAHLAVVNEDETSGHNVVVDGYTSTDYYHLNFGWGGSANGWYLLPDEIPYGLTVVEGVIIDINPSGLVFKEGFEGGNLDCWSGSEG